MKEKRLSEIEESCENAGYISHALGQIPASTEDVRELIAEIRRLRHVLERVKAVWEDVHDETSIVGIIDNALGMEE